ncbi:SDR family oxidoreductase [Streptomyces sp. NPDC091377]|uniref:SDR family oxidoreductase n=1 Tax=Streptomyces sp. NPDC091377 TaxID=3365995 RepID=UPI0037F6B89F
MVTGAASGIGRATAHAFAEAGAHVVLVDRDAPALRVAAAGFADGATPVHGDISRTADCRAAAEAADAVGLPVRALVNCAATFLSRGEDATAEDWDVSLGTNVKGTALMTSAVVPLMRRAGGGTVVNIASVSGHIAQPAQWTYNATKGALLALTRCQALDLAEHGIRVNSVSPGLVWTPEVDRMTGGDRATWGPVLGDHHILRRVGEPEEVAAAVLFLCGPGASFVTGTDLAVDGGYLAMGHIRSEPGVLPGRREGAT